MREWLLGVLCALIFSGVVRAQVSTGAISGTVTDPSGAVIPGAKVVVLNEDTGISRTIVTDSAGHYTVLSLALGNYQVTASAEAFATVVRTGIVLTVGQEAVVDVSMAVGATTQSVEVSGAAPPVETNTATLGSLVDDAEIRDLPLNGRSYDQLADIQPGVTLSNQGPPTGNPLSYGTGERFSVEGKRPNTNLFLLDGTDVNDQGNGTPGGAAGTNLGVDTILEFRIVINGYKAEYGHSMGSVITAVTRSGSNALHGTAFEYIRNSVLDAKNFFDLKTSPIPSFRRNQFGGVLGGPIKKDKLFFFGGYEGLRQGLGTTLIASVPTALARQGILPTGTVAVNPSIAPYLNLYPLPNGVDNGNGTGQYLHAPTIVTNEDNFMGRVDYQINASNAIFARYTFDRDHLNAPQAIPFQTTVTSSERTYLTVQWNKVLSSKALNNVRFSLNRMSSNSANTVYTPGVVASNLAFMPGAQMGLLQVGSVGTSTGARIITPIGPTSGVGPIGWLWRNYQWSDDYSYIVGKHSFKIGGDVELPWEDLNNSPSQGAYTFTTYAQFLEGVASNLSATSPLGVPYIDGLRQILYAAYAQDDYAVNSRLTLNLGLRYEITTDPHDAYGKTATFPSPAAASTVPWSSFFTTPKKNFQPRVGLAWELTGDGKTVLRAAAGIYQNQILPYMYYGDARIPPYSTSLSATNPVFPNGYLQLGAPGSIALTAIGSHLKTPTDDQYNVSLQRELPANGVVQLSYSGNRGTHLDNEIEADSPVLTICSTSLANCPASVPNGAYYIPPGSPRRNPAWAGIRYIETDGVSRYDALTVLGRRTASSGLVFQVAYTFSKALDDSSGVSPAESQRSPQAALIPDHIMNDWGLSDYNSRNNLVGQFTYPLRYRNSSKVLGALVNAWALNGIFTYRGGQPLTPILATPVSGVLSTAGSSDRPNLIPGFSNDPTTGVSAGCTGFATGTKLGTSSNWYNPCAFSQPIAGTFGNIGRNTVIGPALSSVDFALVKDFKMTEKIKATFRTEVFNTLNHPNFGLPNTTALASGGAANPTAGQITYTVTSSRQIQFALRLSF